MENSLLFEIACMLERLDHVARFIVNGNHGDSETQFEADRRDRLDNSRNAPSTICSGPALPLFPENFLHVADLLFHFPARLLGLATLLQIPVSGRSTGFFFDFALRFVKTTFEFVFCT
jgi:hypothetical protein